MDDSHARAYLTDQSTTVSLEFEFNAQGEIISVFTPARYREVSGHYELTPWGGKHSDYREVGGYLIPKHGEVSWYLKDKTFTYWKANLAKVEFV